MYAIIEVGSKQFRVQKSDVIEVEQLDAADEKDVSLDRVLLVSADGKTDIGQPYLKGAKVIATVLGQKKAKKAISFKYRRRKSSHWKKGHRQKLTRIKIKDIVS